MIRQNDEVSCELEGRSHLFSYMISFLGKLDIMQNCFAFYRIPVLAAPPCKSLIIVEETKLPSFLHQQIYSSLGNHNPGRNRETNTKVAIDRLLILHGTTPFLHLVTYPFRIRSVFGSPFLTPTILFSRMQRIMKHREGYVKIIII